MNRCHVRTPADALAYITECTLVTVFRMAMKKSRAKYEYERQKAIAQRAIDWMTQMDVDVQSTMARDVILAGSVEKWAATFEPKQG